MATETRLLLPSEAAERLCLSSDGLRGWRAKGFGPPFVKLGARRVRYRPEDVEAFVNGQLRASTSATAPPGELERGGWNKGGAR